MIIESNTRLDKASGGRCSKNAVQDKRGESQGLFCPRRCNPNRVALKVEGREKGGEDIAPTTRTFQLCTMSRPSVSTSSARSLSLTEELEKLEQQITLTLQGPFIHMQPTEVNI